MAGSLDLGLYERQVFVVSVELFWRTWSKTMTHPESLKK